MVSGCWRKLQSCRKVVRVIFGESSVCHRLIDLGFVGAWLWAKKKNLYTNLNNFFWAPWFSGPGRLPCCSEPGSALIHIHKLLYLAFWVKSMNVGILSVVTCQRHSTAKDYYYYYTVKGNYYIVCEWMEQCFLHLNLIFLSAAGIACSYAHTHSHNGKLLDISYICMFLARFNMLNDKIHMPDERCHNINWVMSLFC